MTIQGFNRFAPTYTADADEKEEFCSQLQDALNEIPIYDARLLMGDFNAQICNERKGLILSWDYGGQQVRQMTSVTEC